MTLLSVVWKRTRKFYSDRYITDFPQLCILKYADLLLDNALRPVREGLGSYTTLMVGWGKAYRAPERPRSGHRSSWLTVPPTLLQEHANCTDFITRIQANFSVDYAV